MKNIFQCFLLLLFFTGTASSFAEEIKVAANVRRPIIFGFPQTGKTVPYLTYLDDGFYEMGNPVKPRFTAGTGTEVGTVIDNATGLMWEQKTDDNTIHDYNNPKTSNPTSLYTWADAFDVFLKGLNTANFAGHNDWRIPNVNELQSIVNYGAVEPSIYSIFNTPPYYTRPSNPTSFYWTSTTRADDSSIAWWVDFHDGDVWIHDNDKTANWFPVRAVRGPD